MVSPSMVRQGAFAYTWDIVGDPAAAERIADLGVDTVTLQATYHSVRAMTSGHPRHRTIHAEHSAAYFRLRAERWAERRLRPRGPGWGVDTPDRFGTAAAALTAAGLRVEAWLVLAHGSVLGASAPELTAQNAFGESYPYALCPAQPAVRDYALGLIGEVCEQYQVSGLMLEAAGWLGFSHPGPHEKIAGADLSAGCRDLLSVCLCAACRTALQQRGMDAEALAHDLRTAIDRELRDERPVAPELAGTIGVERAGGIHDHRASVVGDLLRRAAEPAGGSEVLLMAADDPQTTGPDAGVDLAVFDGPADAYVLKCWGHEDTAVARIQRAASRTDVPIIANVTVLEDRPETTAAKVGRLLDAGARQVRYYHFGLASRTRLAALRTSVAAHRTDASTAAGPSAARGSVSAPKESSC